MEPSIRWGLNCWTGCPLWTCRTMTSCRCHQNWVTVPAWGTANIPLVSHNAHCIHEIHESDKFLIVKTDLCIWLKVHRLLHSYSDFKITAAQTLQLKVKKDKYFRQIKQLQMREDFLMPAVHFGSISCSVQFHNDKIFLNTHDTAELKRLIYSIGFSFTCNPPRKMAISPSMYFTD